MLSWSDPAFADDPPAEHRLRHAACLIAGTSWASDPDFKAVAGEDLALHGNWIGVSAADRAVIAMALHVGLGGDPAAPPAILARLAPPERLTRGAAWGYALRLAQRLGGGAPGVLARVSLSVGQDGALELSAPPRDRALIDGGVERRLARLAAATSRTARVST